MLKNMGIGMLLCLLSFAGCSEKLTLQEDKLTPREAVMLRKAEAGIAEDQYQLALAYGYDVYGEGVPRNDKKAIEWIRMAAEQDHAGAQTQLGNWLLREYSAEGDEEAFGWFRQAADQGHDEGLFYLAFCYARGRGVTQNDTRAKELYTTLAQSGTAYGQVAKNRLEKYHATGKW